MDKRDKEEEKSVEKGKGKQRKGRKVKIRGSRLNSISRLLAIAVHHIQYSRRSEVM
jgi:hypothetical protein